MLAAFAVAWIGSGAVGPVLPPVDSGDPFEPIACPEAIHARIEELRPDAIVVLGAALRVDGTPGRHLQQRAFEARAIWARLGRRPTLVFSGGGHRGEERQLSEAEKSCALRLSQLENDSVRMARLGLGAPDRLSEAETLCAILGSGGETQFHPETVYLEGRSASTVGNARLTTPLLQALGVSNVLLVTTPVTDERGNVIDDHPKRALREFVRERSESRPYRLSSVGCSFRSGVAPLMYRDEVEGGVDREFPLRMK